MKKTIKKSLAGAMLAVLTLGSLGVHAYAKPAYIPKTPDNAFFPNADFIGVKVARLEASTSPSLLVAGQGLLYGVCAYGSAAVAGQGSIAFDTTDVGAISNVGTVGYAISPLVYALLGTASATASNQNLGCWVPKFPVQYLLGLVGQNSNVNHGSVYYYRPVTGLNP